MANSAKVTEQTYQGKNQFARRDCRRRRAVCSAQLSGRHAAGDLLEPDEDRSPENRCDQKQADNADHSQSQQTAMEKSRDEWFPRRGSRPVQATAKTHEPAHRTMIAQVMTMPVLTFASDRDRFMKKFAGARIDCPRSAGSFDWCCAMRLLSASNRSNAGKQGHQAEIAHRRSRGEQIVLVKLMKRVGKHPPPGRAIFDSEEVARDASWHNG